MIAARHVLLAVSILIIISGSVWLAVHVFQLIKIDAAARHIKHGNWLWPLISVSGQNSSGLLLYFIKRRKYPADYSAEDKAAAVKLKKAIYKGLVIQLIGGLLLITWLYLTVALH
ncbi:hypothetical protein [Vagococcus acidifermentans]|uniref:Uncharacterized protein n=1 Tax=Vagococcus acidifermentans TaxID=564710 RepID=A0A430B0J8_9ENTE|nr:hypothetical protein [Vagococcus acidifermentans]RSU13848.1 hypothetical protein CBF27_02810 [Vagococcus acidifermentans]